MLDHAEVVGLEEQLTVPARHRPDLVDLWISIRWNAPDQGWSKQFTVLAQQECASLSPAGSFQVVSMSDRQGFIVARSTNVKFIQPRDVESLVRGLVARTNSSISPQPLADASPPPHSETRSERVRSTFGAIGGLFFGMPPAKGRGDADIASS
jgi:hypothetical protein